MSKIFILFALMALACCVNAQFPTGLFNKGFLGFKGFHILTPEDIINLPTEKNGNMQGSYVETSQTYDSKNGAKSSTKIIKNDNGDVKEYNFDS